MAFSSSARRLALRFLPPRLMKYWIIRTPDPIPPGDTSFLAIVRAIWAADPENVPRGGCVESVVTVRTHLRVFLRLGEVRFRAVLVGITHARSRDVARMPPP